MKSAKKRLPQDARWLNTIELTPRNRRRCQQAQPLRRRRPQRAQPPPAQQCRYCEARLPSVKGLRNHERAFHQTQVSADLAQLPTSTTTRANAWSKEEVSLFLGAVSRFGLKHNSLIARDIGTKSATQVAYFKRKYAKEHPLWAIQAALPVSTRLRDCGTQSSPSRSPTTSVTSAYSRCTGSTLQPSTPSSTQSDVPPSLSSPSGPTASLPEQTGTAPNLSLGARTALLLADKTLATLRGKPPSPTVATVMGTCTPSVSLPTTPLLDLSLGEPTTSRQGADPVERDFRYNLEITSHHSTVNAPTTGLPQRGRIRRLQGHLSSPSTADDCSPPPTQMESPKTISQSINTLVSTIRQEVENTPIRRMPVQLPSSSAANDHSQLSATASPPPAQQPTHSGEPDNTHHHSQSSNTERGSSGPHHWYNSSWGGWRGWRTEAGGRGRGINAGAGRGDRGYGGGQPWLPHPTQASRHQTQGWEEWGEGPRGKGRGKGKTSSRANPNTFPGPPTKFQRGSPWVGGWREGESDYRDRESEPNGPINQVRGRGRGRGLRGTERRPMQHLRQPTPSTLGEQEDDISTWDRAGRANHLIRPRTPRNGEVHPNTQPGPPAPYPRNGPRVVGDGGEWREGFRGGVGEPNDPSRFTNQSRGRGWGMSYRGKERGPTGCPQPPIHHQEHEADQLVMDPDDNSAPEKYFDRLLPLSNKRLATTEWRRWCGLLDRWTQSYARWTAERSNGPHPPTTTAWRRRQQTKTNGPRNLYSNQQSRNRAIGRKVAVQKEYRQNAKRCMSKLRNTPPPQKCSIPVAIVTEYFTTKQSAVDSILPPGAPPTPLWPDVAPTDLLETPFTADEVRRTLRRMNNNSCPGPDRLQYSAWKRLDPSRLILTTIFNTCRLNAKIPPSWKTSTTILIHKGDDPSKIENWRPIALQNTLYKIYAAAIAKRISNWALTNNILSPSQKGFLPFDGCLENGFILRSVLQDSRRNKKEVGVAWLDLKDAFGSVPHSSLLDILQRAGLRSTTLAIIEDIYKDSSTCIQTTAGLSAPIPCSRGVKQGCTLSPILFDVVMEVVIRAMEEVPGAGYQLSNINIKTLTYADDLCALTSSPEKIQLMLSKAEAAAKWAGLTFNPRKCAALTIFRKQGKRQHAVNSQPTLGGEPIPALPWDGTYKYLGCRLGADPKTDLSQVSADYIADCEAILRSDLTDWQKLDAIHRFAKPRLVYLLQNTSPTIGWARNIDKTIRALAKTCLKLPGHTVSAFLYTDTTSGGLGLPNIEDELHIFRVSSAFKLLSTPGDHRVRDIAYSALSRTAEIRSGNRKSPQEFLNSLPDPGEGNKGDLSSLWSDSRVSFHHCNAKIDTDNCAIICDNHTVHWPKRSQVPSLLRSSIQNRHKTQWSSCSDQGRTVSCISKHAASNHWIRTGKYTSFGEYRFALKARLNLLPTRTARYRAGEVIPDRSCRKCNTEQETLAHILNHCPNHVGLLRLRHNKILSRLANAIPAKMGRQYKEQVVPGDRLGLKPDLVVLDDTKKEAFVIDVTTPFEGTESFSTARLEKERKYGYLKALLGSKGYQRVEVDAFIVGSLGSWDTSNEQVLQKLGIGRNYSKMFRNLCCTEALKGSFSIWKTFLQNSANNST